MANSQTVAEYARRFAHGDWSTWPNGEWDRVAEDMVINFSESGHPVFRGSSALERGALRSKDKGKLSIHFCDDDDTAELVLRTLISVNQLSIYGAVAEMTATTPTTTDTCAATSTATTTAGTATAS